MMASISRRESERELSQLESTDRVPGGSKSFTDLQNP